MYEKLLERRSVRKYKPEQVSDELLPYQPFLLPRYL